jgi:geranylgeranyl diphosphate synthase type I
MKQVATDAHGTLVASLGDSAMPFAAFADTVRVQVEDELRTWLEGRVGEATRLGGDVATVASSIRDLVTRGGKRLRPTILAAAYDACGGQGGSAAVKLAGVALELLQGYLLIHDDWMDGDETRRGGPSVPALMRAHFSDVRSDAMSVLAGDLAAAWARRALLEVPLPADRVVLAAVDLAEAEEKVVHGQVLDVAGVARNEAEIETTHALKTASYSVRAPAVMGGRLSGASEAQIAALRAYGDALGVAFQLRDDLLGIFGDSAATGKPAGTDLVRGRRSAVLGNLGASSERVARVFGRRDASESELEAAVAELRASGAVKRVEARIEALSEAALAALKGARFVPRGAALLRAGVEALTQRQA